MADVITSMNSIQARLLVERTYNDMTSFMELTPPLLTAKATTFVGIDDQGRFIYETIDQNDETRNVYVKFEDGSARGFFE